MSGNETRKDHADDDKTIAPQSGVPGDTAGEPRVANDDPTIMGSRTLTPDESRAPLAGTGRLQIEGYEILEELGRGGMGVVYKARDVELNRIVAIKMILAGVHAGEESLARFRIEAEAVAQLQHPGIVQVYDVGQADGQPFCALEYVEGGSLDQVIRDKVMPIREAVALVESLAHAMQSAHQAGIVHRDLKPPNILLARQTGSSVEASLTASWTAKITDFGLAKKVEQESQQTQTGAVMGTPSYMAPEQARGVKRIGPAADVYSLGAILYELITGQPPFSEETPIKTIMRVMSDPPPSPRSVNPAIDRDLDTICLKCLEKEPAARYASAEHLAQDLERYLEGMPIEARPVSGIERTVKWIRRKPLAASLIAVSTLGLIGLMIGGAIFNTKLSAAYHEV
ncbi:MAG: serine/threonine-protein kinase, partial [Pirellulaceae bacterium]